MQNGAPGSRRIVSSFIPYQKHGEEVFVYLQKRANNAPRHAGYYSFFGGGSEAGETPEQTLVREMQEELGYVPRKFKPLGIYNFDWGTSHIFISEVEQEFESLVEVKEGEYGEFFSEDEISSESNLDEDDRRVLRDFYAKVKDFD